jgi:hypothetical protein
VSSGFCDCKPPICITQASERLDYSVKEKGVSV